MQPRTGGLLLLAAIMVVVYVASPNNFYLDVAIQIGLNAMVVVGLNLLIGYAGQISLGHAGFFGLGAYASAVLPVHFGVPPLAAPFVGMIVVGLLAFVVARPILRLKGHYLAMATLGLGILVFMLLTNESDLTGGPDGMIVERLRLFGERISGKDWWYWIVSVSLLLSVWLTLNLIDSPTGRALRALHDSEVAAQVAGVDVARFKVLAFVYSAVLASLAGSLSALYSGFVTPDKAGFLHSIELVTMVVLGGMGSTFGGIVGAAVLTSLPQFLTAFAEYEHMLLGLILMAAMIFMRRGLLPSTLDLFARRRAS